MKSFIEPLRVALVTLGCDKNTVDMEYVAGLLHREGCTVIPLEPGDLAEDALLDAVVVLTCGFIADAKEQSIESIVAWAERKKQTGSPRFLYVAGCLAQRYGAELFGEIPEVDGMLGVGHMAELAAMIRAGRPAVGRVNETPPMPDMAFPEALPRRALEEKPYAFLKIADGCDHACAFCAIPGMKGKYRSVAREILLEEARALLDRGVREINLIAQDITPYGRDLYEDYRLPELLRDLCRLPGDFWIRCLYAYPSGITDELIAAMGASPKIVPYLDIPLQHLDPGVLQAMRRPASEKAVGELVARLRTAIPDIALRTTFLVGHPGESVTAFNRLIREMRALAFPWVGAFAFSEEEGTPATVMPGRVGKAARIRRRARLLEAQASITEAYNHARIGKETAVLIESVDEIEGVAWGRSPHEAPEVDGQVRILSAAALRPGDIIRVRITAAAVYDLEAEICR